MSSLIKSKNVIEVRIGEGAVASHPYILTSAGLGSCVVVELYEIRSKLGGTAHIMLPEDIGGNHGRNIDFYLDTSKMVVKTLGKRDKVI